ncbi:MAG: 5-formyltetrahydrofolate cyclo-ligase [Ruminococcus sp.]|nr:5-formyltetrahydrofolate cyclo-ligase [Ruminococcus sp.]
MPIKNIKHQKEQIRNIAKKYRANLNSEQKEKLDIILQENFLKSDYYKNSQTVLAFVSKDIEISTDLILQSALKDGKTLALPKCREENKMDFFIVKDLSQLKKGYYDLLEPDKDKCEILSDFENSICLVPGLVFDREGFRLGFGKGYYDRFLQDYKGICAGMCYCKLVESKLPRGFYDKPVDVLFTEKFKIDMV